MADSTDKNNTSTQSTEQQNQQQTQDKKTDDKSKKPPTVQDTLNNLKNDMMGSLMKTYNTGVNQLFKESGVDITKMTDKEIQEKYAEMIKKEPDKFVQNIYVGLDKNNREKVLNAVNQVQELKDQIAASIAKVEAVDKDIEAQMKKKAVNDILQATAEGYVNKKLDELLDDNIKKVLGKFGYDTTAAGCIKAIEDVVRAFKYATYDKKPDIDKCKEEVQTQLTSYLDTMAQAKLKELTDHAVQVITPQFDKMQSGLQNADKWLDKIQKLDTQIDIASKMQDNIVNSVESIDKAMNNVLQYAGMSVDFSGAMSEDIKTYSNQISDKINNYIKPALEKETKVITVVRESIKQYEEIVQKYEQQVQELVKQWEEKAQNYIKEQETKIVKSLVSSIKFKI